MAEFWPLGSVFLDTIVKNTTVLSELGIPLSAYDKKPDLYRDDLTSHVAEVFCERAQVGPCFTAWDGSCEEEFDICVYGWGGVWFAQGLEQFDGFFLTHEEATNAAKRLATCFPKPDEI